ncbi:hypothetical protein G3I26_05515, partial [Streptomyces sp. SID7909]|nr:hypothetical protein [Streptomyces sp. SID7909]
MDHAWTAAQRLAEGRPVREALGGRDSAEDWVALDLAVRYPPWYAADRWVPSLPDRDAAPTEPGTALALCHRDGRIRGAALDRVSRYPDLLPLLVVRCTDWAAPVRERARALLAEAPPAGLVAQAELILLLDRRERGGFAAEQLGRALREGPAEAVHPLLESAD